ncbi:hypothetical protein [Balneatrix alpica]|uniref:SnoaL-like domain-containing protein n=1 Tax=Balneatrix alpica TaxID=75684 RepID=A0ABV5ZFF5_9GAMM|nr:hypothetical protein [Balneatrix alpica]
MKKLCVIAAAWLFVGQAQAAMDAATVNTLFNSMIEHVQNEDAAYFNAFKGDVRIHLQAPEHWQMGTGALSLEEYKAFTEEMWLETENHNFDIESLDIIQEGTAFRLKAKVWERSTLSGDTIASKADINAVVVEAQGMAKIQDYKVVFEDVTEQDWFTK